jgi:superfamily II DNA or RNA helicase
LLDELYVPMLTAAVRYDRCCAYFSSSVLSAAARGFAALINRLREMGSRAPRPAVRLVINEEMDSADVRALTETGDTARLESVLIRRLKDPKLMIEKERLALLGWLAREGYLEVRIGVMRHGSGIVHAKFGIATDSHRDAIVFNGSGNETAQGLLANYERLEVSTSWNDPDRHQEYASEFEQLWQDSHPDVHTVTLPEALRLKLIRFAAKDLPSAEPTTVRARQKAAMLWRFIVEAPYLKDGESACDNTAFVRLWPHQERVVDEVARAWPEGRLLCDEVGMGKTIEAILILKRLMAGRGVRRVLLLLPAGLLKQWQDELREKGGLVVPRLEGPAAMFWPGDRKQTVSGLADALKQDWLIMSREYARADYNLQYFLDAEPWDLLLLDEAHAARRSRQIEGEYNSATLLLTLLRKLQLERKARGILLLSATPMQTHPWEPWDLLATLGVGGRWLADFDGVRKYYSALAAVPGGSCTLELARPAAVMAMSEPSFPARPTEVGAFSTPDEFASRITFAAPSKRAIVADWLRRGSPLERRMHRNTHTTLRQYYVMKLLDRLPPDRIVTPEVFDYSRAQAEREVYRAVGRYIEKRFEELEQEKKGKGFVMTIYRRRASSSPLALRRSLDRRRQGLLSVIRHRSYDASLIADLPEDESPGDEEDDFKVTAPYPDDPEVARRELSEVERLLQMLDDLRGQDWKRDTFFKVLKELRDEGRAILIFSQHGDTVDYLRDSLADYYRDELGCFSGKGGQLWNKETWQAVSKTEITDALQAGRLRILVCTDAASEGLNLQSAGSIINYDLPWNPSRVEQRIGRIDRIGQKTPTVKIVNMFLKDSVDERVYAVLHRRCRLFEQFVGPMQPVLSMARRMLYGREEVNLTALESEADEVEHDPLPAATYIESTAEHYERAPAVVTQEDIVGTLSILDGSFGVKARHGRLPGTYVLSGPGLPRTTFAATPEALEQDESLRALSPHDSALRHIADQLLASGEHLPLVVGACERGAFRRSVIYWLAGEEATEVSTFSEAKNLVADWNGVYPEARKWLALHERACEKAAEQVSQMEQQAAEREREALKQQVAAARLRLLRELGRFLVSMSPGTSDLNGALRDVLSREIAGAERLRHCLERLGGFPEWASELLRELQEFSRLQTPSNRKARRAGSELDAALEDPRWSAKR